jgi:hypothetical protein
MKPFLRIAAVAPAVVLALALGACGGYSASNGGGCGIYGGTCPPTNPPPPVMTDCSALASLVGPNYQVQLNLIGLSKCNDTTFGLVLGFSAAGAASNVVKVPAGMPIVFINKDTTYMHTADSLGASFPGSYGMGTTAQRAASAAGTLINDPNFSTGTLALNGGTSAVYTVPAKGTITLLGCYFYYNSFGMRTAIIAQ